MRAATGTLNGANSSGSPSPRSAWSWQRTATRGRFAWATSLRGSKIVAPKCFKPGRAWSWRARDRRRASAGRHGLRIRFARGRREHLRGCRQDPFRRHALPPRHRAQGIQTLGLNVVGTGRFELPTCRLGGDRSIHLSYVPETTIVSSIGGPMEISTFRCGKIALRPRCAIRRCSSHGVRNCRTLHRH